jgi:hypothetical protein
MTKWILAAALVLGLGFAASVTAAELPSRSLVTTVQTVVPDVNNPTAISFTPSTDHASIDSYEMDILRPDGTVLQTLNIGKPAPDATNTCVAAINVQPVKFGVGYSVRLRALAGGAASDYVNSDNKFNRVPGAPSKVKVGG